MSPGNMTVETSIENVHIVQDSGKLFNDIRKILFSVGFRGLLGCQIWESPAYILGSRLVSSMTLHCGIDAKFTPKLG